MKHAVLTAAIAAFVSFPTMSGDRVFAQAPPGQDALRREELRREIAQRFDVLPLQNGVALRPKSGDRRVRSIEVTDGAIAIDGAPATGAELRDKLGTDAELVLRLSYLDAAARQQLFGTVGPAPEPDRTIQPPAESRGPQDRPRASGEPGRRARRSRNGDDRVRFGGTVTVAENEVVDGDAVAIGGSINVDGEVTGDAVAIGGGLVLGPRAYIHGDAVVIGGSFKRDDGARVDGKIVDLSGVNGFDFGQWRWNRFPDRRFRLFGRPLFGAAAGLLALLGTLMRVVVLCALSCIVLFAGREFVEQVGARAAEEPLKAGAIGLLAQLLFLPLVVVTTVVFVITIIGIPLLLLIPFALLAFAVLLLIGFTAVAYNVGHLASARFAWRHGNPYLTAVTGIVLLVSPVLIARVIGLGDRLLFPLTGTLVFLLGLLAEYLAWTVGIGAVALLRFGRSPAAPPLAPPVTV